MSGRLSKSNVLIVAPGDDLHALVLAGRIRQLYGSSIDTRLLDTAPYPIATKFEWRFGDPEPSVSATIASPLAGSLAGSAAALLAAREPTGIQTLESEAIRSIWWRRPRGHLIHPGVTVPEFEQYCARTASSNFQAFLSSHRVHNAPAAEERASRKPFQLWVAQRVGLVVPRTLITADPRAATDFVLNLRSQGRQVVYKQSVVATDLGIPTRLVQPSDLARIETLGYAPAIFQEQIAGGVDLRVAVAGARIFACEWRTEERDSASVDIRLAEGVRMWPGECPTPLVDPLLRFHRAMDLTFGVYDFKMDAHQVPHFLEVNPSGQWLDMEMQGNQPLSESWARMLVDGSTGDRPPILPPLTNQTIEEVVGPNLVRMVPTEWAQVI